MPVFSLDNGRLSPARPSLNQSDEIVRETLMAVRDQVVELIYRPIFPVAWLTETGGRTGRHTSLVALDPSGKTVTVDVVEHLDTSILMGSLARASRHEEIPRGRLSGLYPRGTTAFRKDWQEFLDSCPSGIDDHPRLIILAVSVDDEVRAALDSLVGASIEVHRIDIHESRTGLLVSLEQVRPHEASFLAIGRAVQRGEITPPSSPAEPIESAAKSIESDHLGPHAEGGDDVATESPADIGGEPALVKAAKRDGVVFVSRGAKHANYRADGSDLPESAPAAADADSPIAAQNAHRDPVANETDGGGAFPRAPQSSDDDRSAAAAVASETAAPSAYVPESDHVEDVTDPAVAGARDDRDDVVSVDGADGDQEMSHSAGVSADGTDVEATAEPWRDEPMVGMGPDVSWPERTTELQDVASRFGALRLSFRSLRRRVNTTAQLTADGEIVLENGDRFGDPDEAATAVAGRRMDGWKYWRTDDGTRLGELRR